MPDPHEIF
jgi:V-type H+-transporting ATPase subunit E